MRPRVAVSGNEAGIPSESCYLWSMNAVTRRGLLTAGLGISAGMIGAAPAHAGTSARPGRRLRVMTFNIHHGEGIDGVLDLERIADVIRRANPDVVGLQEVDRHWSERSDRVDQARWLARRLGWEYAFGANLDEDPEQPGEPRRQYGTALLTRFRILSRENILLPRFPEGEQRGLLRVRTRAGVFCSTHLQHDNAEERRAQAEAVVAELSDSPGPTVVVGDLNAVPGSPELQPLTDAYQDSWELVGNGDGSTYPAEDPDRRIDYVLADPGLRPVAARVVSTESSDHLPYLVDYLR